MRHYNHGDDDDKSKRNEVNQERKEMRGGNRKGAGRPATGRNKKPQIAAVVTQKQKDWMVKKSNKEEVTLSELILTGLKKLGLPS